jgi:hypothetical protein
MPSQAENLRAQAARLFVLALDARNKGDDEMAEIYTARATQYSQQADDSDAKGGQPPPSTRPETEPQRVTQQQQQPQPKQDE